MVFVAVRACHAIGCMDQSANMYCLLPLCNPAAVATLMDVWHCNFPANTRRKSDCTDALPRLGTKECMITNALSCQRSSQYGNEQTKKYMWCVT